jgi:hypothetical protein
MQEEQRIMKVTEEEKKRAIQAEHTFFMEHLHDSNIHEETLKEYMSRHNLT